MSRPRVVVIDTNVVVAGLLTQDADAPTVRILDAMLAGDLRFAVSVELLAEYREVLLRRRIRSRHGLSRENIDSVLEEIALNAVVTSPRPSTYESPDPGDQHLWDLLESLGDAALVTGDEALRGEGRPFLSLSPRQFLEVHLE